MTLRRSLRSALIPAIALALGAVPTPAHALSGSQEIAFLNAQRAANGLPAGLTEEPAWSDGCAKHMAYLALNGQFQHTEDPGLPGYTPEGADAGGSSVLTSGGSAFSEHGENAFESAPLHLMQMLNPWMERSGAAAGCLATLRDLDRTFAEPTTFSYPGDGATVPVRQTAFESPFVPGDFVGLPQGTVTGPHLYFYAAGPGFWWDWTGHITSATLSGPGGPVEVRTVDDATPTVGGYLSSGGIVIPVAPLQRNAQYTASVTFQPDAAVPPLARTWSFVTGTAVPQAAPANSPVSSPGPAGAAGSPTAAVTPTSPPTLAVSTLKLTRTSLSLVSSADATLWVTIDRHQARRGKRAARWVKQGAYPVTARAGGVTRLAHPKLARGRYRLQVRTGDARGELLLTRAVALR